MVESFYIILLSVSILEVEKSYHRTSYRIQTKMVVFSLKSATKEVRDRLKEMCNNVDYMNDMPLTNSSTAQQHLETLRSTMDLYVPVIDPLADASGIVFKIQVGNGNQLGDLFGTLNTPLDTETTAKTTKDRRLRNAIKIKLNSKVIQQQEKEELERHLDYITNIGYECDDTFFDSDKEEWDADRDDDDEYDDGGGWDSSDDDDVRRRSHLDIVNQIQKLISTEDTKTRALNNKVRNEKEVLANRRAKRLKRLGGEASSCNLNILSLTRELMLDTEMERKTKKKKASVWKKLTRNTTSQPCSHPSCYKKTPGSSLRSGCALCYCPPEQDDENDYDELFEKLTVNAKTLCGRLVKYMEDTFCFSRVDFIQTVFDIGNDSFKEQFTEHFFAFDTFSQCFVFFKFVTFFFDTLSAEDFINIMKDDTIGKIAHKAIHDANYRRRQGLYSNSGLEVVFRRPRLLLKDIIVKRPKKFSPIPKIWCGRVLQPAFHVNTNSVERLSPIMSCISYISTINLMDNQDQNLPATSSSASSSPNTSPCSPSNLAPVPNKEVVAALQTSSNFFPTKNFDMFSRMWQHIIAPMMVMSVQDCDTFIEQKMRVREWPNNSARNPNQSQMRMTRLQTLNDIDSLYYDENFDDDYDDEEGEEEEEEQYETPPSTSSAVSNKRKTSSVTASRKRPPVIEPPRDPLISIRQSKQLLFPILSTISTPTDPLDLRDYNYSSSNVVRFVNMTPHFLVLGIIPDYQKLEQCKEVAKPAPFRFLKTTWSPLQ